MTTPNAAKLIDLFAALDDNQTGFLPFAVVKALLTEVGDKMKDEDFAAIEGDLNQDGMFPYKVCRLRCPRTHAHIHTAQWYCEEILCNGAGIGAHQHWLKLKA